MPPTLLSVAVGVLVGLALLGAAFGRRSLAVVALAAAVPDVDAALGALDIGAANATLHSIFVVLAATAVLYYDTEHRERSWLRRRYGWYGVRVAWVAIAAYAVAGIGVDLFSTESVALFYPLGGRYYAVVGKLVLSTQEGVVQTYIETAGGLPQVASPGTVESYRVDSWWQPETGSRRLQLVEAGWQAIIVATAVASVLAKALLAGGDR